MFKTYWRCKIGVVFSACVLTVLVFSSVRADDIEIFLSRAGATDPNVLFILDGSGSMEFYDCAHRTGNRSSGKENRGAPCPDDDTPNANSTRMERMVDALTNVVSDLKNVNVGLMRFSHEESGGRIIYPMTPVGDARSEIIDTVGSLFPDGKTPSVGALWEAKNYFEGGPVEYGKRREWLGTLFDDSGRYSRISHKDSYTGGTRYKPLLCPEWNLDSLFCKSEKINGNPQYISPIVNDCNTHHIVLLTDGSASQDDAAREKVEDFLGISCDSPPKDGYCGKELAEYLYETDLAPDIDGMQNVTTHTIGFNVTNDWLKDVAEAGGGGYHTAKSSSELVGVFNNIFTHSVDVNTGFSAPGAAVDRFSRTAHRSDIYLALFKPSEKPSWVGNLKKYKLKGSPPKLYDANDNPSVNPNTGQFEDTAKSYWSAVADGQEVPDGGAASLIVSPGDRNIYTNVSGEADLTHTDNKFADSNPKLTKEMLAADTSDLREEIIDWARGVDVRDDDEDGSTSDARRAIGDPLHSSPVIITYGETEAEAESVVIFGTNEGFIHAIDADTGAEEFAFIPRELLPNLHTLYHNRIVDAKPYGMDGALSLWMNHTDDKITLYAGMRRGGKNYYALDMSDKEKPSLKWQITGGAGAFAELGYTWSKPVVATIDYLGSRRKVIIFGGGYDDAQDNHTVITEDTMGRAVYIVDASNGSLLWSGGPDNTSFTKKFDGMKYSIPSNLRVIDLNGDGLADQIFFGDMGGQLWRLDLHKGVDAASALVDGGVIAALSTADSAADARRFYHAPDVSLARYNGKLEWNIAVGSGYQAHPLDTTIKDSFFVIHYTAEFAGADKYGIEDVDPDDTSKTKYRPITVGDLFNATADVLGTGTADEKDAAFAQLQLKEGWLINMDVAGEKVLGAAITVNKKVFFTSYLPEATATGCDPSIGKSRFWALNLFDGTGELETENTTVRNKEVPGAGIAPSAQAVFVEDDDDDDDNDDGDDDDGETTIAIHSGPHVMFEGDAEDLVQRVYWSEFPNF